MDNAALLWRVSTATAGIKSDMHVAVITKSYRAHAK